MFLVKLIRKTISYIAYAVYLIFAILLLLEATFRILPTTAPIDLKPITDERDILRYRANQTATFSLGPNFYQTIEKETNNYGFYSSYDYVPNGKPDILIIGDSYVEASQVRNKDSMAEILQSLKTDLSVYQLGISGVALSQYIQMIKYADREFSPQNFAIIVVGNDFDESLCSFRIKEGTWCFDNSYKLIFNPFLGYQGIRHLARKSAFLRYSVFQYGFNWRRFLATIGVHDPGLAADHNYAGNTERFKSEKITVASRAVITEFFNELNRMNVTDKVTIIIDADRRDIYTNSITESYFKEMRLYLMETAIKNGVSYIDMDLVFREDYEKHNKIFEFPTDGHWNKRAHLLASQSLLNSLGSKIGQ